MPHTVTLSHSALVQEEFLHRDNPVLWCDLTNPISPFDYKPERNKNPLIHILVPFAQIVCRVASFTPSAVTGEQDL